MRKQCNNRLSTVCVDWPELDLSYVGRIITRCREATNSSKAMLESLLHSFFLWLHGVTAEIQFTRRSNQDGNPGFPGFLGNPAPEISEEQWKRLYSALHRNTRVLYVMMKNQDVNIEVSRSVSDMLVANGSLTSLIFHDCQLHDDAAELLATALPQHRMLRELHLRERWPRESEIGACNPASWDLCPCLFPHFNFDTWKV
jgi:hypothetical protein